MDGTCVLNSVKECEDKRECLLLHLILLGTEETIVLILRKKKISSSLSFKLPSGESPLVSLFNLAAEGSWKNEDALLDFLEFISKNEHSGLFRAMED